MAALKPAGRFILLSIRWMPRILCILFAMFASLFSFDVFGQEEGFWKTLAAFLVHNIPSFVIIALLVLSWKWSWIGGAGFITLGLLYQFLLFTASHYLIISIPLFVIGMLFLLDWVLRKKIIETE